MSFLLLLRYACVCVYLNKMGFGSEVRKVLWSCFLPSLLAASAGDCVLAGVDLMRPPGPARTRLLAADLGSAYG